jgi:hypothetical protein
MLLVFVRKKEPGILILVVAMVELLFCYFVCKIGTWYFIGYVLSVTDAFPQGSSSELQLRTEGPRTAKVNGRTKITDSYS